MPNFTITIDDAVGILCNVDGSKRNWQMPGNPRYQPDEPKPFLGYDSWALWCIIVEWFWMETLADNEVIPQEDAECLTMAVLENLLLNITTTQQDEIEKNTRHDILALLELMRKYLPEPLHKWLHYGATSYDIISTAYALQAKVTFSEVFWPKLVELDELWREKIGEYASVVQAGRTHLQTALPVTVGFWLTTLHDRFFSAAVGAKNLSLQIPGKFSGAVGTKAAQVALTDESDMDETLMEYLGLATCDISTQIAPPEAMARYYFELVLLSGALANLGEDVRILQSSQFGELTSVSSTSSAMSHKTANPISAENLSGMHESVKAAFGNITGTLVSDLQRDLRNSSPMRQYSEVMVYVFQQIKTAIRLLKSIGVDEDRCRKNFDVSGTLIVAELLHLSLQQQGLPEAHHFVNTEIIPLAKGRDVYLNKMMDIWCKKNQNSPAHQAWLQVDDRVKEFCQYPERYIGNSVAVAKKQCNKSILDWEN